MHPVDYLGVGVIVLALGVLAAFSPRARAILRELVSTRPFRGTRATHA
jgi:hypothetical protein